MIDIIKTRDGNTYRRVSNWLNIHCNTITKKSKFWKYADNDGTVWTFRFHGHTYALDQYVKLPQPEFFVDESGKDSFLCGFDSTSCYNPLYCEIDENSERIRLFEEIKK